MEKLKFNLKERSGRIIKSDPVRIAAVFVALAGWGAAQWKASEVVEGLKQDLADQKRWTEEEACLRWLAFEPSKQQSELFAQAEDIKTEGCERVVSNMKFEHVLVSPSVDGR